MYIGTKRNLWKFWCNSTYKPFKRLSILNQIPIQGVTLNHEKLLSVKSRFNLMSPELCQWQPISAKLLSHDLLKKVPSQIKPSKSVHWDILPLHDYYSTAITISILNRAYRWLEIKNGRNSIMWIHPWNLWIYDLIESAFYTVRLLDTRMHKSSALEVSEHLVITPTFKCT